METSKGKKIELCKKEKCTACLACVQACPVHCINIGEDECGNMTPIIDYDKCVACGKCQIICPMINKAELNKPMKVYASYSNDNNKHKQSASGGLATEFAESVIKIGGVVYGAAQTEGLRVEHIRVDDDSEISKLQGSKYVHSHINNQYKQIKQDLDNNRKVLFVGTPCQVSGLRNYLDSSEYDNLICVDLICHGVPSWKTFIESIEYETAIHNFDKWTISFRDIEGYSIKLKNPEGEVKYIGNLKNSFYFNGFMEGYIFRRNCYCCEYAQPNRVGDITLGDFWGLGKKVAFEGDKSNGINVVLINTNKGKGLFDSIKNNVSYWERSLEEAVAGNGQLRTPAKQTRASLNFIRKSKEYNKCSIDNANALSVVKCKKKKYVVIRTRDRINKSNMLRKTLSKIPIIKDKI